MSDCNTQAMKPKERRTCGTCAHCQPSEWHCDSKESEYSWMVDVDDVDLPCGGYGYERRTDGLAERRERTWTEPFEAYMPNGERVASLAGYSLEEAYSILVRHERLEQVAREMYRIIATFESRFEADHYSPFEWAPEHGAVTRSAREQLEALGVSVDD